MSDLAFSLLKIKWAFQGGSAWARLKEWSARKAAWCLPRSVALWAFYRVIAASGENPDVLTWTQVLDWWESGAGK